MSEKLKPCPFCGGEAYTEGDKVKLQDGFGFWFVACKNQCGVMLGYFNTENEAIKKWNRRAYNGDDKFDIENREKPKENEKWWHFKGKLYTTLYIAKHTETGEELVICKNGDGDIFARPLDMFMSEVDREKYPNARQKYPIERAQI